VDIADSKLITDLSATEVMKPLRRMVLELGTGAVNVRALKSRDQMIAHVLKYDKDLPNLSSELAN